MYFYILYTKYVRVCVPSYQGLGPYRKLLLFIDHPLYTRHLTLCTLFLLSLFTNLKAPYPRADVTLEDTYPRNSRCEKQHTDHVLPVLL